MNSLVLHYQEIALKGRNRPWFISRLVRNLRTATRDLGVAEVRPLMGRIEMVLRPGADRVAVADRVRRIFGVANFSLAGRAALDVEEMSSAILKDIARLDTTSFRVSVRRADKRFPLTSPELEREVGGRVRLARGWKVDLSDPKLTILIEIVPGEAFYSFGKQPGAGGLPVGVSGKVACLLSGGIDSPVAAWRLMRRGCPVQLIHFHSYPIVSLASQEKVRQIAALLTQYQLQSQLFLVAFGNIQRQVVLAVPAPMRVVVYRRLMVRIAEGLARANGALALVTGEVVGQVASQTIENLTVIGSVSSLPILRPLVGMDKDEITSEAQRIGTYPISILPDEDCCQVFTPKHPLTRARADEVERAEAALPIQEMVENAVREAVAEQFNFPQKQGAVALAELR